MGALNIVERVAVRITIKVMQRDLKILERERDRVKEDLKRLLFEAHAAGELVTPWPERRAYRRRTKPPSTNAEETPPLASSEDCGPGATPAEARTPGP